MPEGKVLVVMLTGAGEDAELVPELHPLANESDKSSAKASVSGNAFGRPMPRVELMLLHVDLVMKLLLKRLRRGAWRLI